MSDGKFAARAAMLAQTIGSAGTFLVVKNVLGTPDHPGPLSGFELMTLRFAGAGAILTAMLFTIPGAWAVFRTYWREFLWLGFLAVPLNVGLFFEGAARAPAAHAALFYALTPIFVFVLERAAGRTAATRSKVFGLTLALAGALTVLVGRGALSGPEPLGDLMLLGAAASWGLYTVGSRPLVAAVGSRTTMVLSLLTGTVLWLPAGIPISLQIDYAPLTWTDLACVGYTALVTTVICYSLWLFALKRLEPTQVAVFTNLQPVATVVLAWMLLGDPVNTNVVIATVLILLGVSLVQFGGPRSSLTTKPAVQGAARD